MVKATLKMCLGIFLHRLQ